MCCLELCKPASLLVTSNCDIPVNCCVKSRESTCCTQRQQPWFGRPSKQLPLNFHSRLNVLCDKRLTRFIQVISSELYNVQVNQAAFCNAGMPSGHLLNVAILGHFA